MFVYEDLNDHYDILKKLVKTSYPNAYACLLNNYSAISEWSPLATVNVKIRNEPDYNAYVGPSGEISTLDEDFRSVLKKWTQTIKPSEERQKTRANTFYFDLVHFFMKNLKQQIE